MELIHLFYFKIEYSDQIKFCFLVYFKYHSFTILLVVSVIFADGPIPLSDLQVTLIIYVVYGFKLENF